MDNVEVAYVADPADQVVALAAALHEQDREYYGARTPAALALSLQREALPLALIALRDGIVLGTATLSYDSITTYPHLGPWLKAFYVRPEHRGRGVGGKLVAAIEAAARRLGFTQLYAGSGAQHRCSNVQAGTSSNVCHTMVRRLRFSAWTYGNRDPTIVHST